MFGSVCRTVLTVYQKPSTGECLRLSILARVFPLGLVSMLGGCQFLYLAQIRPSRRLCPNTDPILYTRLADDTVRRAIFK